MVFFELNKTWKLIIYWLGIFSCFGSLIGWILLGIWFNLNWGENIFKARKEGSKLIIINKELKGVEKIFFVFGLIVLLMFVAFIFL